MQRQVKSKNFLNKHYKWLQSVHLIDSIQKRSIIFFFLFSNVTFSRKLLRFQACEQYKTVLSRQNESKTHQNESRALKTILWKRYSLRTAWMGNLKSKWDIAQGPVHLIFNFINIIQITNKTHWVTTERQRLWWLHQYLQHK